MSQETTPIGDDLSGLLARISDSAARLSDLRQQTTHETRLRNSLIVRAVDEARLKHREVAKAAGISVPTVTYVLSGVGDD